MQNIVYSEKYDTYYNSKTNEWVEDTCDDPTCEFCINRPLTAEECVCDNNWRSLTKQYDPLMDKRFMCEGEEYIFVGLLRGSDDYYFCMHHRSKGVHYLSCVGNPETYGFVLVVENNE